MDDPDQVVRDEPAPVGLATLLQRRRGQPLTAEEALALFRPMVRQVVAIHQQGWVAPLVGLEAWVVEGGEIQCRDPEPRPARAAPRVHELDPRGAVVPSWVVQMAEEAERDPNCHLPLHLSEQSPERPAFVAGYRTWEHLVGHHDPLCDLAVLGQVFVSLLLGFDLADPGDLTTWVRHRTHLFALKPELHPVLAKIVVRMTELSRHRRAQDLEIVLDELENYREIAEGFVDWGELPGTRDAPALNRRQRILTQLQERLFELTRRNRWLDFRPSLGSLDLTLASVPLPPQGSTSGLEMDLRDALFCWNPALHQRVVEGRALQLESLLHFADHPYAVEVLDRLAREARRDQADFGFSPLQLVVAFLSWTDLREGKKDRYRSPLLLLPVQLEKKKGLREGYRLLPRGNELQINPVLRYLFRKLYGLPLPTALALDETTLPDFLAALRQQIAASEPGILLELRERLPVAALEAAARRRRGDFAQRRRRWESGREEGTNPYLWEVDLCAITLGNFRGRRMALVRDYEMLVAQAGEELPNKGGYPSLEGLFSEEPRPNLPEPEPISQELAAEDDFTVVPCDPTQFRSLALVRRGHHLILQGPPGTGKSQTITNLIADAVAHGRRVLFVCEKRAAIDVVFHRLSQQGLDQIASLIHDAQTDKKALIGDLRAQYAAAFERTTTTAADVRSQRLARIASLIAPLDAYDQVWRSAPEEAGLPIYELLQAALGPGPEVSVLEQALAKTLGQRPLPPYRLWQQHRADLCRLALAVDQAGCEGILARHPLAKLAPSLVERRPRARDLDEGLRELASRWGFWASQLRAAAFPSNGTPVDVGRWAEWAERLAPLARQGLLPLVDPRSGLAAKWSAAQTQRAKVAKSLATAASKNQNWREKPSLEETRQALADAQRFEGKWWAWLAPGYWRLRRWLAEAYDFSRHRYPPSWIKILGGLEKELALAEDLMAIEEEIVVELGWHGNFESLRLTVESGLQVVADPRAAAALPQWLAGGGSALLALADSATPGADAWTFRRTWQELGAWVSLSSASTLEGLVESLEQLRGQLSRLGEILPCWEILHRLPGELSELLRCLPFSLAELEAGLARQSLDVVLLRELGVERLQGPERIQRLAQLEEALDALRAANAELLLERQNRVFRELVALSEAASTPGAPLTAEQKERKKRLVQGRRMLEHELGKTMRHRSIRDLLSEAGDLILALKPIWLMSPLSVADTLPLRAELFDLVIFDEASQITLESAVPSMARAPQLLVVGDPMQLPPTMFFTSRNDEELSGLGEASAEVSADPELVSLLDVAARSLPSHLLGWHYRSRAEALIAFSNAAFYQGRLVTIPEPHTDPPGASLNLRPPFDGERALDAVLERSLSFHRLEGAVYSERTNRLEARYIAELVRATLRRELGLSLAIIAFSQAQQVAIEEALDELATRDPDFDRRLEAELEREEDGQFVGLLVRNLENIQGDERDLVILSVCYGPDPQGRTRMQFGPIVQGGGERRLNVAFSRAKCHMAVVASIDADTITNDYNQGAAALKYYLAFAAAIGRGDQEISRRILRSYAGVSLSTPEPTPESASGVAGEGGLPDRVASALASALEARGWQVDPAVGRSQFRCDLAIKRPGEPRYRAAILIDTPNSYRAEIHWMTRDVLRPALLRRLGWQVLLVLSKDFFRSPADVLAQIERQLETV